MGRTVELAEIARALQCTDANIRDREGRSMPPPVSDRPRTYVLTEVLWWVNGTDRTLILQALQIDVNAVRRAIAEIVESRSSRYFIPSSSSFDSEDPLMQ